LRLVIVLAGVGET